MEGIAYLDNRMNDFYDMLDDFWVSEKDDPISCNTTEKEDQQNEAIINNRYMKLNNEIISKHKHRKINKGYDSELGYEVAWIVYSVDDLNLEEREQLYNTMIKLKDLEHPNILKYLDMSLNNDYNELIVITELITEGSIKSYLK